MYVRFLAPWKSFAVGTEREIDDDDAKALVASGAAEVCDDPSAWRDLKYEAPQGTDWRKSQGSL